MNIIGTVLLFDFIFVFSYFLSKKLERIVVKLIGVNQNDTFVHGFYKTESVLYGSKIEFRVNVESSISVLDGYGCTFNGMTVKK